MEHKAGELTVPAGLMAWVWAWLPGRLSAGGVGGARCASGRIHLTSSLFCFACPPHLSWNLKLSGFLGEAGGRSGAGQILLSPFLRGRALQVLKVAILAEKYAVDYTWYVDTILNLIRIAGDYVSEEVWYRVIQIVINRDDVQGYAAKTVFEVRRPSLLPCQLWARVHFQGRLSATSPGFPRGCPG